MKLFGIYRKHPKLLPEMPVMEDTTFNISFELEGKYYSGWVVPSEKLNKHGKPDSFHVIVNEVSFGYISFSNSRWINFEQRSSYFIDVIGKQIDDYYRKKAFNQSATAEKAFDKSGEA